MGQFALALCQIQATLECELRGAGVFSLSPSSNAIATTGAFMRLHLQLYEMEVT